MENQSRLFRRLNVLLAVALVGAFALASCSKPHPQNRYDWAMELAKSAKFEDAPKDFLTALGDPAIKGKYVFSDMALNRSFIGKFEAAARDLEKQGFYSDYNHDLLTGILADSKAPCDITSSPVGADVDCGDREDAIPYWSYPVRLLHTDVGNFLFASADWDRGNSASSNENSSALIIIVDPSDGGVGLALEDRIATVGGRPDVLAAVLTLASSLVRLDTGKWSGKVPPQDAIRYDLQAAKSKTIYQKHIPTPEEVAYQRALEAGALDGADAHSEQQGETQADQQPAPSDQTSTQSPGPLTKDQFTGLVLGKTMAQIRSIIGDPSNVESSADGISWYYWKDKLPVQDPDSGVVFTSSVIRFDPDSKIAIRVGF